MEQSISFLSKTKQNVLLFITLAFFLQVSDSYSEDLQVTYFGDLSIFAKTQFRTRQCDTNLNIGATFYSVVDENEPIPTISLSDTYPGTSFIAARIGLESAGRKGFCFEQFAAWRFGSFGPQISYNIEYTFSPSWSSANVYDVLASSVALEQPFLQLSDWSGSIFTSFHHYYSVKPTKVPSTYLSISKSIEQFIESGATISYQANPGFRYEFEFIYQYGLSNFDTFPSIRANATGSNNVFKVALNSLTALDKSRTPGAQFALSINVFSQYTLNPLPFYQSCRSGRKGFIFLHAIDYYQGDICTGIHSGIRYAQDWSLIDNMYVELSTDYLAGTSILTKDSRGPYWQTLMASIAITTKPYELSDTGGQLIIGYPILGEGGQSRFVDKINFSFNLNFNF